MSAVVYPIPYETSGLTARMTYPREFQVSDDVVLEIRDVSLLETVRVASGRFSWPTQNIIGQGGYNSDEPRHNINPAADIRVFEDALYAPVRCFDMTVNGKRNATAFDIGQAIGSFEFTVAHPFERLYQRQFDHRENLYAKHRYGNIKPLRELKLIPRSERDAQLAREYAIAAAKDDLAKFIAIDGEIWRRLEREPVIAVSTLGEKIDITIEAEVNIGADRTDYFRLSGLEECLEFVAAKYPGKPVRQHFANLEISIPEALVFQAEADAIRRAARLVERALSNGACWMDGPFGLAYEHLKQLTWRPDKGTTEDYVEALQALKDHWNDEGLTPTARESRKLLTLTLDRWEMRPVRGAGAGFRR